jgi:hypothetical protein
VHRLVAGAAHGPDQPRAAELAPQLCDVDVDRARPARIALAPDAIEQTLAVEHEPRVLQEVREQVELPGRQLHRRAGHGRDPAAPIELDVPEREAFLLERRLGAAQHRLDAGDELSGRERLRDVVVGTQLEPRYPIRLLVARGQDDYRQARVLPDRTAEVEPVGVRQLQVENCEPDLLPLEREQAVDTTR